MIDTHWTLWGLDVWGNAEDGWNVNDRHCLDRDFIIPSSIKTYNKGKPEEFTDNIPSDKEIVAALIDGGKLRPETTVDDLVFAGDDCLTYINEANNDFPILALEYNE